MKMRLLPFVLLAGIVLLFGCQKEVSTETGSKTSRGSLQAGLGGDCLPKTIFGTYEAGTAVSGSTHYIDVQVNVTEIGSYAIHTDTMNGIFFGATGIFTNTGMTTVTLKGGGTPVVSGITNFLVRYDTTSCIVSVTVVPVGGATPAVFALVGSPGLCGTPVISGTYAAGTALTPSNTVVLKVNVTTAGSYTITTPMSNGMTFTGSGALAAGAQTITLTGSGTPAVAGDANFPVTAGTSTCSFVITTTGTTVLADYFPRTAGSNWSYEYDGDPNDTLLLRAIAPTATIGGNVFNVFEGTVDASQGFDSAGYFRKSGGLYYRFEDLQSYLGFDNPQRGEFVFLKDDQPVAHTWTSPDFTGAIGGTPVILRISFKILEKDVSVTVKGVSYPNTIVVEEKYFVNIGAGFQDATSVFGYYKDYYSRNVGWILDEHYDDSNTMDGALLMRRAQVNP
jgi:hypothetical protein